MASASNASLSDHLGLRPNRACRNCVQIKAKCVPLDNSMSVCQRCHRLGKHCTTPAPATRRRARSRSKEQGLDRTTILLTPSSLQDIPATVPGPPSTPNRSTERTLELQSPNATAGPEYLSRGRTKTAGTVFEISPELAHNFVASTHEALFEQYATKMARYFPFVVIPAAPPATIFQHRPFLYTCCVLNAAHRDPPLQARIGRDVLRYVCEHMFLSGEKSLDLLQGLLVICAWYHVYTHSNPQLMNIFHLARALLVDLGLNGGPGFGASRIRWTNEAIRMVHGTACLNADQRDHNLEERRVCLAMYFIHSRYCRSFRRLDPTVWTEYLQECCTTLEQTREHPSDAYAVALVRLCHLVERFTSDEGFQPGVSMPVQTYTKLVSKDLNQLMQDLPDVLRSDDLMKVQLVNAEMSLLEPVIFAADASSSLHKVEALYFCLKANTAFFDAFLALKNEEIPFIPFLVWVMVAQALDVMATLSFTTTEGWDLSYVRTTPGFIGVNTKMIEKMLQVQQNEEAQNPQVRSIRFKKFAQRLEMFMQWYEGKIQSESSSNHQTSTEFTNLDNLADAPPVLGDFSDLLWHDFMADWPRLETELNFL